MKAFEESSMKIRIWTISSAQSLFGVWIQSGQPLKISKLNSDLQAGKKTEVNVW